MECGPCMLEDVGSVVTPFADDIALFVAGYHLDARNSSTSLPRRAGRSLSRRRSTARLLGRVVAPGSRLDRRTHHGREEG